MYVYVYNYFVRYFHVLLIVNLFLFEKKKQMSQDWNDQQNFTKQFTNVDQIHIIKKQAVLQSSFCLCSLYMYTVESTVYPQSANVAQFSLKINLSHFA